jgi:hypothetical protein
VPAAADENDFVGLVRLLVGGLASCSVSAAEPAIGRSGVGANR